MVYGNLATPSSILVADCVLLLYTAERPSWPQIVSMLPAASQGLICSVYELCISHQIAVCHSWYGVETSKPSARLLTFSYFAMQTGIDESQEQANGGFRAISSQSAAHDRPTQHGFCLTLMRGLTLHTRLVDAL